MRLKRSLAPSQLLLVAVVIATDLILLGPLAAPDAEWVRWLEIIAIVVWGCALFGIVGATLNRLMPRRGALITVIGGLVLAIGVVFRIIWPEGIFTSGVVFIGAGLMIGVLAHHVLDRRWSRSRVR